MARGDLVISNNTTFIKKKCETGLTVSVVPNLRLIDIGVVCDFPPEYCTGTTTIY